MWPNHRGTQVKSGTVSGQPCLSVCLSLSVCPSVCLSVERIDVHVNSWKTIFHRNLLKTTSYLIALEKLHVLHSVETFESSNKEGLIKGIWRNHSHQKSVGVSWFLLFLQSSESCTYWYVWFPMDPFTDPSLTPSCGLQASMLVAALCLDYKVYDTQIWNGVLQQLVHFGLVRPPLLFILSWILRTKIFIETLLCLCLCCISDEEHLLCWICDKEQPFMLCFIDGAVGVCPRATECSTRSVAGTSIL